MASLYSLKQQKMPPKPRKVTVGKNFLFSSDERQTIWQELVGWYDENKKDLPWRKTIPKDAPEHELHQRAYEVLVSEIMLQQTQVETVKTYFTNWMKKFPTVKDLSDATIDEVTGAWSGLGK